MAVNETGLPDTQLPFTLVDAEEIAEALTALGYQPLDPDHPILSGRQATRSAIIHTLTHSQRKKAKDHLLIYFTGHGIVSNKELWLQTYGQFAIGPYQGLSLEDLVLTPRTKGEEAGFAGNLAIILDTCYSGKGILSHSLKLGDLGRNTTIFSSSTKKQESYPLKGTDLPPMSAFTYSLLQAMGPRWPQADWDGDGMLRYAEIHIFSKNLLQQLHKDGHVKGLMEPKLVSADQAQVLAYRREQVRNWHTPYRLALQTQEINQVLAEHLQTIGANPKATPDLPKEAQALAKGLEPAPEDFYAQALKVLGEGDLKKARILFAKAETQSQNKETAEETKRQEALKHQEGAEVAKQVERDKRYDLNLARARMESYDGQFTEAFAWYRQAAHIRPPTETALLNEIGQAAIRAGTYPEAEPYLHQALQQREQDLDPKHPDIGTSLNNLATLYRVQGKYAEAEPLAQRALRINEAALGPDHPDVGQNLNNLATLYRVQGKYAEAEPLAQRALRINEAALGPDHPDVGQNLNNLATLYRVQGKYAEAEPLAQRALRINEAALGPDHPDVGQNLNNLATLYRVQGKYAEAEPLAQRALRINEAALGPDHPDVGQSLNNLATLYRVQGKYAEAEPLARRALRINEAALGPDHPNVALNLNNLAALYAIQKKYEAAEILYKRSILITEMGLGSSHPDLAKRLNNLGELYRELQRYSEAEPLYLRALRIDEASLGPNHPNVATDLHNLAALYNAQGKFEEAAPLYLNAYNILKRQIGLGHPDTKALLVSYSKFLLTNNRSTEIAKIKPDLLKAFPDFFSKQDQ